MSANVDLVRSIYSDWERGDFSAVAWAHPDIEYVFHGGPEPGRWTGVAEMAEAWFHTLEAWEDYSGAADDFIELEDERVLVLTHIQARGKSSGIEIGQLGGSRGAPLLRLCDAKVTKLDVYWERDRAFADLGVERVGVLTDKVQVVKRGIAAYNARDIDLIYEVVTPDFEWIPAIAVMVEGGSVRGREGMERYFEEVRDTWREYRLVTDEFRDLGDCVLVLGRIEGRRLGSGVEVDTPWGAIFDFRDDKLSRARAYLDHGAALKVVGPAE